MNYSKQRLTRIIQGTNARTIPTQLNSVRHLVPYKGSIDAKDLLDLYVGNTHYRQINKALRADDINVAKQQVWDEEGLMKLKLGYDGIPDSYSQFMKTKGYENNEISDLVNLQIAKAQKFIALGAGYNPPSKLYQVGYDFAYHPLAATNKFNNLPLIEQSQKVLEFGNNPILKYPSSQERQSAEAYFQQVLASAPHIENALVKQPQHAVNSFGYSKQLQPLQDFVLGGYDKYYDAPPQLRYDLSNSLEELGYLDSTRSIYKTDPEEFKQSIYGLLKSNPPSSQNNPISRGLHFKDRFDYHDFMNEHQPGNIVEYPSFTSTTILPNIQEGFASARTGEIPVFQNIIPADGSNMVNAYDVNNPAEGERLYPPGQRFKVVSSEPISVKENFDWTSLNDSNQIAFEPLAENQGRQITLQETNELPYIEQRTRDILSRMKPRIAEIAQDKPRRRADFIKQGSSTYQAFIDGKPYKKLTPEEMQQAVKNTQNAGWQVRIK